MEEGLCVALFPGIGNRYVHVFSHLGECVEIVIYQLPCFFPVNVETLGKTKHGDAIDDAKIGPLGFGAFVALNLFNGLFVYFCRSSCMDIVTLAEGLNHVFVAAQVCHYS